MLNIGAFARLGQVSPRMLRHYDEIGLLRPDHVDRTSGYRLYNVHQLERLHRIVALRDMGFGLEEIGRFLSEKISLDELRGMLRMRRSQIQLAVGEERERLRRVEAHLRALEWRDIVELQDIVIKRTQPVRAALSSAAGLTHDDIGAAFGTPPQSLTIIYRQSLNIPWAFSVRPPHVTPPNGQFHDPAHGPHHDAAPPRVMTPPTASGRRRLPSAPRGYS